MTLLDTGMSLRDIYLGKRGLEVRDFGLNYSYPIIPATNWDWFKAHKFGTGGIYRRSALFLIYLDVKGEPYLLDEVPYGVVRFLGTATGVKDGEPPKMLSQWGRRSELHFEPIRDGRSWESLEHGTKVLHCESLIKAKAVHKATGIPCIGYNGVNGYSSAKQGVELIHQFSGFAFDKMDNVILFDSDVITNPRVSKAREGLSHKLRHISNCSQVSWATIPQRVVESEPASNWGPDDYLMSAGVEALLGIIGSAVAFQDEEFSSLVEEMNERLRWVGNQNMVYDRKRRNLVKWSDAVLAHRNINRTIVMGKVKKIVFGTDVWLQSLYREEVDSVGYRYLEGEFFERNGQTYANEYVSDGSEPGMETLDPSGIVFDLLTRIFKRADIEIVRSYLKFLKYSRDKPTSYCVLWSNVRGVGKGWFTDMARALLGGRHVAPATADSLAAPYNLHTVNTRLVIAHEFHASTGANKKLALQYLKNYVGDETIMVRAMHRNPYQAEVRAGLIITVNDKSEMPSDGLGDRRQWYIEGGAGLAERGVDNWGPEADEWLRVWEALKDPAEMSRIARWIADGEDVDFKSWRPPMTEERESDLIEGLGSMDQIANEVLLDMRELGVDVLDTKMIRQLMIEKMEGQELYLIGRSFARCLKSAGWWTSPEYARATEAKSSAWFSSAPKAVVHASDVGSMIKRNALKVVRKF